jgi:hypothetical protein
LISCLTLPDFSNPAVDALEQGDESIKGSAQGGADRAVAGYLMETQLTAGVLGERMNRFIPIVKPSICLALSGGSII